MSNFGDLVNKFIEIITAAIPVIFAITFLVIVWKIVDAWFIHAGDETKLNEGKNIALAGVIALVVMSSIWGILRLLQSSLF